MRDRISTNIEMPGFWPPKPSGLWQWLLTPLHERMLKGHHAIAEVTVEGMEILRMIPPGDGVLICPNHSYTGDGSLMMEVGRRSGRQFYIMAAWHVFRGHGGLDGFLLQRMGVFSVDREGCDRRAIRQAVELLSSGQTLVIFPEGEIYHLNEKLTPLREGVAFMAVTAQRDIDKANCNARVWMLPCAIRYQFIDDVMPRLDAAMKELESRMLLRPAPGTPLHERIIRYGEMALTIKEKDKLGRAYDSDGEQLPGRLKRLIDSLLEKLEATHLNKSNADETVPVRVKLLRQHLLEGLCEEPIEKQRESAIRDALADVHLVLQLYSYPGDYISSKPTPERMAETIEKFEEDVLGGYAPPKGRRRAVVTFGEPIDVKEHRPARVTRPRI